MTKTKQMPREKGIDQSLSMMREGYMYISNRRHSFNSDVFETRLLGKKAVCMGGKEAAELFYDTEKFKRKGAVPGRVVQSFFGKKGVQTLDGDAHKHRKEMIMSVMSPDKLDQLAGIAKREWKAAAERWERMDEVVLYEEAQKLLCKIACEWAGVPLREIEVKERAEALGALFETAAKVGPPYWLGRNARDQLQHWIGERIAQVRNGQMNPPDDSALYVFSRHRDHEGKLLDPEVAAVEVINILRPIVAIAVYISFLALAVHQFPEEREKLQSGDEHYAKMFIQEVRRFYPFFPFVAAIVKKDFTWNGYDFEEGTLTLLDLYGTNHDHDLWENPDTFKPGRFSDWKGSPYGFIPQGGGDYWSGHRCAGERVTLEVMAVSLDYLVKRMDYDVPDQDLSFSLVSMPSIPRSKVVLKNVRRSF